MVQVSDLLDVVHDVSGVDAVRFLTDDDDGTDYAIRRVTVDGAAITTYDNGGTPARAIDVLLKDDEYPVFNDITIVPKAQNSFGTV